MRRIYPADIKSDKSQKTWGGSFAAPFSILIGIGQLKKIGVKFERKTDWKRWLSSAVPKIIEKASKYLGTISGSLCFGLVLLVSIGIILRAMRLQTSGIFEISCLTLGWICFSSLVYTYTTGEHVKVTIFTSRMPKKWRTISEMLGCLLGSILMLLICWASIPFFLNSWRVKELFNTDVPLPYWLAKLSIPVGTFVFGMVYLADLVTIIIRIFLKRKE